MISQLWNNVWLHGFDTGTLSLYGLPSKWLIRQSSHPLGHTQAMVWIIWHIECPTVW